MDESQDEISSEPTERLEKNESKKSQPVVTSSESVVTANAEPNRPTVQFLNVKPETKNLEPGTCYLISKPNVPVATAGTKASISSGQIIKIISSTGSCVLVCTIKVPPDGGPVSPHPGNSQPGSTGGPKQATIHPNVTEPARKEKTGATPSRRNLSPTTRDDPPTMESDPLTIQSDPPTIKSNPPTIQSDSSTIQSDPATIPTTIEHAAPPVSDNLLVTIPEQELFTILRHGNTNQINGRSFQKRTIHQSISKTSKNDAVENEKINSTDTTIVKPSSVDGQDSSSTPIRHKQTLPNPVDSIIPNNNHHFTNGQISSPSLQLPCYDLATNHSAVVNSDHSFEKGQMNSTLISRNLPCFDNLSTTTTSGNSRKISSTTASDDHRSGNGLTYSPSTPEVPPCHIQTAILPKDSPLKSSYLDTPTWDPLYHHIEYNDIIPALPNDLQYLKESELLPLAHEDFAKYLEDRNLYTPTEMMTLADDDGVVPSSSPPLPGDGDTYMDSSSDGSQEYPWEGFASHGENIYKSPPDTHLDYPQYGTLNWGLTPTIIYKTPGPNISSQHVGDDYMKCSISAGNVELLTPPPANYRKLLRRSRRRMQRRRVKRRRIYFENDESDQGLQEVPVNEGDKAMEKTLDTDNYVPDDPMWFEDATGENGGEEQPFSDGMTEQDIADCSENLRNALPSSGETTDPFHFLNEAVEYIKDLEGTIDDLGGDCNDAKVEVQEENELEKSTELNASCEDILKTLPTFSFDDMDEQSSREIQEILHSIDQFSEKTCELSAEGFGEEPSTDLAIQSKKQNTRKRNRPRNSNRMQKKKRSSQNEPMSNNTARCSPEGSSRSKRSVLDGSPSSKTSSRSNSRAGSRCVTPIAPKPPPGVLLSPSLPGLIHLQVIGSPFNLPKPPIEVYCFSPPPVRSQMISPKLDGAPRLMPTAVTRPMSDRPNLQKAPPDPPTTRTGSDCQGSGQVTKVLPAKKYCLRSGRIAK